MRLITSDNPRPLGQLAFGPDGLIAAASGFAEEDVLEAWEPATGVRRFAAELPPDQPLTGLVGLTDRFLAAAFRLNEPFLRTFAPDGRVAAVAVFDGASYPLLATAAGRVMTNIYYTRQPFVLVCLAYEVGTLRPLWRIEHNYPTGDSAPALSPDGAVAAVLVSGQSNRPRQRIALLDGNTGAELRRIALDPADPVRQLAFTADGATLAARFDSRTVRLFDANTGAPAGELTHKGRPYVTAIAAHPGGPLACARTDGTVTFWDVSTRQILRTLDWKAGPLVSLAFRPDGALAAAGTEDGRLVVWDVDV